MYEGFTTPEPGDLFLCYDSTLLGRAIDRVEEIGMLRRGQKPPKGRPVYSHVAVYIGNGECIEALGPGLVKTLAVDHHGKADIWTQHVERRGRDRIVKKAQKMLRQGYTYSWWDLFVQFAWLIFGLRIPWHQKRSLVCSVFGYDVWMADGIKIAPRRNCAPEDIPLYGTLFFRGRW